MASKWPVALTIAGSDPSGGAGLQADLKTFHQFGVYGTSVPTLLTVQNTRGVDSVRLLEPDLVEAQLDCVQRDIPPHAAKTGALGDASIVRVVARWAERTRIPLVVDPVMVSTHGQELASGTALEAIAKDLLPRCLLVTPNLQEAGMLAGMSLGDPDSMCEAAEVIAAMGPAAVLVKGGHLEGEALDVLWSDGTIRKYSSARIKTQDTHGTGCTLSAAITALIARGRQLSPAVGEAKRFVTAAIASAPGLGTGQGPLNHFARIDGGTD